MPFDIHTIDTPAEIALAVMVCFTALNILLVYLVNGEFLLACYRSFFGFLLNPRTTNVHGSARWLTGLRRYFLLSRNKTGLLIDGKRSISERRSFMHMAVIAPTGVGKTSRYIIPNIRKPRYASYVITDPSGEIYEICAPLLKQWGYDIRVFNLSSPGESLLFNPLARAKNHSDFRKISEVLISSAYPDSSGDNRFWEDGAQTILTILLKCLKTEPAAFQNLANLKYLVDSFGFDGKPLFEFVASRSDEATFKEFESFLSQSEKVMQGMLSTCKMALNLFSDPQMQILTSGDTLAFEDLRARPTALFIIVQEDQVRFFRFLLSILYTQILDFAMKPKRELGLLKSYLPLYCFLDEFGNSGKIPGFSTVATSIRKRKASLSIILQDIQQLDEIYGRSASTIFNGGMASKLFYPGLSLATCQQVEKILGNETVIIEDRPRASLTDPWPEARVSEARRPLLTSDEVRVLHEDRAVFIHGNKHPVLVQTKPYFKKLSYRFRLFRKPPKLPQVSQMTPPRYVDLSARRDVRPVALLTEGSRP